jgi:N utilization substance protein B
MLNRRHIRIKVLQALYAYFQSEKNDLVSGEKELLFSLNKVEELYAYLFDLMAELHFLAQRKMEEGKKRRMATELDLNPLTKFVDNAMLKLIRDNKALSSKRADHKVSWTQEDDLVRAVFKELVETDFYKAYLNEPETSFDLDREFVIKMFKQLIANNERIQDHLEDKSIYWIDDLDLIASMIIKTMKKWEATDNDYVEILPLYRDKEDLVFAKTLYRNVISDSESLDALIKEKAKNWDIDRIALMDMLVMKLAVTEAKQFKNIPTKVTMNEFIEIAKFYSTPKSKSFINGILDNLFSELTESGEISKMGRGLME